MGISISLAQDPQLLLFHKPAACMSCAEREQTTALLIELARSRAVVVIEHDIEFIRRPDCRVTVPHEGAVLAEGRLDHVIADPRVIKVYPERAETC